MRNYNEFKNVGEIDIFMKDNRMYYEFIGRGTFMGRPTAPYDVPKNSYIYDAVNNGLNHGH